MRKYNNGINNHSTIEEYVSGSGNSQHVEKYVAISIAELIKFNLPNTHTESIPQPEFQSKNSQFNRQKIRRIVSHNRQRLLKKNI